MVDSKTYFENTDAAAGNDIFDARVNVAVLADWIVLNVSDQNYRNRALDTLRRVESEVIEAVVYDIENGTTPV